MICFRCFHYNHKIECFTQFGAFFFVIERDFLELWPTILSFLLGAKRNEKKRKKRNKTERNGRIDFEWLSLAAKIGRQTNSERKRCSHKKETKKKLGLQPVKANRRFSSSPLALHFILLTWFCLPCFRHLGPVKNDDHVVVLIGPGKNRMRKKATLFFSNAITSKLIRVEWRPLQLGRRWDWINRLAIPGNELDGNRLKRIGNGNRTERQHWVSIQRSCAERKKNSESNSKWNHKKLG